MPVIAELLAKRAGVLLEAVDETTQLLEREILEYTPTLEKRILIPCCNNSSPEGLVEAVTVDPWQKSGKYALAWVYFCIIILVLVSALRWYHFWHDKIRTAIQKDKTERAAIEAANTISPETDYEQSGLSSSQSTKKFFPKEGPLPGQPKIEPPQSSSTSWPVNIVIGLFRYAFYRPIPAYHFRKGWRPIIFPALGVILVVVAALALVVLYTFVPQPLYWQSIRFGSPPVAIRSGMLAVAMIPWIIALSMKANFISIMTGIGHERLNVLHRWAAYICLLLSLIHTVPFYITPIWDKGGYAVFRSFFTSQHYYVYGSGMFETPRKAEPATNICRPCDIGPYDLPLRSFLATTPTQVLRAIRRGPCSGLDLTNRHAILALSQLSHVLELSIRDCGHMAFIMACTPVLPELDQSVQDVILHWRRSRGHTSSGKCHQSHNSDTG